MFSLRALDRDVGIVIRGSPRSRTAGSAVDRFDYLHPVAGSDAAKVGAGLFAKPIA